MKLQQSDDKGLFKPDRRNNDDRVISTDRRKRPRPTKKLRLIGIGVALGLIALIAIVGYLSR